MKQPFKTEDLKAELERALDFPLRSLVRLDGASALNFKAVREEDGLTFLVKCIPPERRAFCRHLVANLEVLRDVKVPKRLFVDKSVRPFRSYEIICLSWCEGRRRYPDQLTESQLKSLLDDYLNLSRAFQGLPAINAADRLMDFRQLAVRGCTGLFGGVIQRLIGRIVPAESVIYKSELLRVIHGDFHHGNFLFVDGRVTGFFDLEELSWGYCAEDIVRYFVCAAEHVPWFACRRRRRILRRFALAVRYLDYSRDEWVLAINGLLIRKFAKKICGGRLGPLRTVNLLYRAIFYVRLKREILV